MTATSPLTDKRLFVAMRHEKSIAAVFGYASGLGASIQGFQALVMERHIDSPEAFAQKKGQLMTALNEKSCDILVMATKVNDTGKESELLPLLQEMRDNGAGNMPIVLTHLETFSAEEKTALTALGLNLHITEDDNLGFPKPGDKPGALRTGMSKLGPKILQAL